MKIMIDIVIPNKNEEGFISVAEKLGYKEILFLYDLDTYFEKRKYNEIKSKKINIFYGILANTKNIQNINSKLDKKVFIAIKSTINNREIVEKSKANLIFSLEESSRKDFMHQRGSGLDHIMCKLAHDNKVMVGFSLSSMLTSDKKHMILGRMTQNIKLCRKYKVKMMIASFAQKPLEMRGPYDVISLFVSLGMHQKEAKDSLITLNSHPN